jgi:hypothetical protein
MGIETMKWFASPQWGKILLLAGMVASAPQHSLGADPDFRIILLHFGTVIQQEDQNNGAVTVQDMQELGDLTAKLQSFPNVMPLALEYLSDPEARVRLGGIAFMSGTRYRLGNRLSGDAWKPVHRALVDSNTSVRERAALLLADEGLQAIEDLTKATRDPNPRVRNAAIESLRKVKPRTEPLPISNSEISEWQKVIGLVGPEYRWWVEVRGGNEPPRCGIEFRNVTSFVTLDLRLTRFEESGEQELRRSVSPADTRLFFGDYCKQIISIAVHKF